MHTVRRTSEKNWDVCRLMRGESGDVLIPMFVGCSLVTALRLTSILNGGTGELGDIPSVNTLDNLWERGDNNG